MSGGDGHRPTVVDSTETAHAPRPAVAPTPAGAARLGDLYWRQVEASTAGLVRVRPGRGGPELRVLGVGPALVRLGEARLEARPGDVSCRHAIAGGLLVRDPGGWITFEQRGAGPVVLRSTLAGYVPRLAPVPGRPRFTGAIPAAVQTRIHSLVSRRYLARLVREAGR